MLKLNDVLYIQISIVINNHELCKTRGGNYSEKFRTFV